MIRPAEAALAFRKSIATYEALRDRDPKVAEYRSGLARGHDNLGILLRTTGRPADAAAEHEKAQSINRDLVATHADRPDYLSALAGNLSNRARALRALGRLEEAAGAYREAIARQRQVVARAPAVTKFRRYLSDDYFGLTFALRTLGRASEAAAATRERIALWPESPDDLYNAACELALCVPLEPRAAEAERLSAEAVALLRRAVSAGWSDAAQTGRDTDLAPLRGRADFQALLASMWDRSFPMEPFARGH
jgi:tetratricopeptide (TPR) repeat protein